MKSRLLSFLLALFAVAAFGQASVIQPAGNTLPPGQANSLAPGAYGSDLTLYGNLTVKGALALFPPMPLVFTTSSNSVYETQYGNTNTLLCLNSYATHYRNTGANLTNWVMAGDSYSATNTVYLTNCTLSGLGSTFYSALTNSPAQFFWQLACVNLASNSVVSGLIFTNLYPWPTPCPMIRPSGRWDFLTISNSSISSCGSSALSGSQFSGFFLNSLFYTIEPTNNVDNSFTFFENDHATNCIFSNCVFVATVTKDSGGYAPIAFESGAQCTNRFNGCAFIVTNNPSAIVYQQTNLNLMVASSDPCYHAFTNCTFSVQSNPVMQFDRSNATAQVSCALEFVGSTGVNGDAEAYFVNCRFNLACGGGNSVVMGAIFDLSGTSMSSLGPILFKDCYVTPDPGTNVIFFNNGFPVTIQGGNLSSANFSEPAKITTQ